MFVCYIKVVPCTAELKYHGCFTLQYCLCRTVQLYGRGAAYALFISLRAAEPRRRATVDRTGGETDWETALAPHTRSAGASGRPGSVYSCKTCKRRCKDNRTAPGRRCASWHTAVHTSFSKRSRKNPVLQKPKPFAFSYADGLELQLARAALCAPGPMVAQRAAARTSRHEGPEAIHIRPIRAYGTSHAAPRASACAILFTIALLLRVVGNRCVSPTSSARTSGKHVSGPCSEVRRSALTALIVIPPSASHACTLSRPSARLPSAPR